jgi:hypothetical protein
VENQTQSLEPIPELSAPPANTPEPVGDPLLALALAAKAARLAPADEAHAQGLLQERLAAGRAGINAALEPMVAGLPWIVCVNAVTAIWEQLSAPMRRHLLSSIAKNPAESARRLELSLARAVFKLEPATGVKLAAAAAANLKDPETGAFPSKHRQFFFNVLIGKGKPWLLQLPLADLKSAEADALVHGAFECLQICPPFSQLSILRWASDAGRLGKKTSAADLELAAKAVGRWNIKLQRQLKAEIAELPPAIAAVLKPEASEKAPPEPAPEAKPPKEPKGKPDRQKKAPAPVVEVTAPEAAEASSAEAPGPVAAPLEELVIPGRAERLAQKEAARLSKKQVRQPSPEGETERPERPERREKGTQAFDLKNALRGVESYVASLRSDLEQAKAELRRKEEKPDRRSSRTPEAQSPAEADALTRHNARLEATISELRLQLEDLRSHHEAIAESRLLHSNEPMEEGSAEQLRALLAIKLAEEYETYIAMRKEALDKVFRLDYRDLLGKVFETLLEAGIHLNRNEA